MTDVVFCWSGGKDSALALHKVLNSDAFNVRYLLTTLNKDYERISMHGVREELLELQVAAIGIPLVKVYVSAGTNKEYEQAMEKTLLQFKSEGIETVVFGDIFLEDLRAYRDNNLAKVGMKGHYPLWQQDTRALVHEFIDLGFASITCCVNDAQLNERHVGAVIDAAFVCNLPEGVDPCGENGEFHSFAYQGPIFKFTIPYAVGEKVYRPLEIKIADDVHPPSATKGFWYCDLLPKP